jgi:hypothetical protein
MTTVERYFPRALEAYLLHLGAQGASQEPSLAHTRFLVVAGGEAFVLGNAEGPVMAFRILLGGQIGERVDLQEEDLLPPPDRHAPVIGFNTNRP